jgi:hypothetical protein
MPPTLACSHLNLKLDTDLVAVKGGYHLHLSAKCKDCGCDYQIADPDGKAHDIATISMRPKPVGPTLSIDGAFSSH